MKCSEVEKQIISGEPMTEEAQAHLLVCERCQAYSLACLIAEGRAAAPSPETDYRCRHLTHFEDERFTLRARGRFFMSIAAGLLLFLGIMTYLQLVQQDEVPVEIAETAVDIEDDENWMLLADDNLELLELGQEEDKAPMKELYNEIVALELDYYNFF